MAYNKLICSCRRLKQAICLSNFNFPVHVFCLSPVFNNKFLQPYSTGPVITCTKCKSCIIYFLAGKHSFYGRPRLLKSVQIAVVAVTCNIEASARAIVVLTHFRNLAVVIPTRRKKRVA
jgi:hypothetical protein